VSSSTTIAVRRVDFGYFLRPGEETATGVARVEPVLGYLVEHPNGTLLVDTGMGTHPEVDAHYRPRRIPLSRALADAGSANDAVDVIVNCHLHFDHCGGNPELAGRTIFVQDVELSATRAEGYTLTDLIDAPGLAYEQINGDAEVWPGVMIVPTPYAGATARSSSSPGRATTPPRTTVPMPSRCVPPRTATLPCHRPHRNG
jgi:N-acyl homoserine lactone hydrolase